MCLRNKEVLLFPKHKLYEGHLKEKGVVIYSDTERVNLNLRSF